VSQIILFGFLAECSESDYIPVLLAECSGVRLYLWFLAGCSESDYILFFLAECSESDYIPLVSSRMPVSQIILFGFLTECSE